MALAIAYVPRASNTPCYSLPECDFWDAKGLHNFEDGHITCTELSALPEISRITVIDSGSFQIEYVFMQMFLFGNKMDISDRIHVHVVTPKCALSCQEGNVSLGKKLFTNVDFLGHTVCNSCIHAETFLHMNKKDLYCLYSSIAICIWGLNHWFKSPPLCADPLDLGLGASLSFSFSFLDFGLPILEQKHNKYKNKKQRKKNILTISTEMKRTNVLTIWGGVTCATKMKR